VFACSSLSTGLLFLAVSVSEWIRRRTRRRLRLESLLDLPKVLLSSLVDRRIAGVDVNQGVGDHRASSYPGIPLTVGGNHVPRCPLGTGMGQHLRERLLILLPVLTLAYVG